jgi:riboflavin synthase
MNYVSQRNKKIKTRIILMFTGLIETIGILKSRKLNGGEGILNILPLKFFCNLTLGESIAINGTCLTLSSLPAGNTEVLPFNVLGESFKRTNLGTLKIGSKVNLERALAVGSRLGGHMVQGHVDAVGKVLEWKKSGRDKILKVEYPEELKSFLINKGSIALDGISLTIVDLKDTSLSVHLIPTTLDETCLGSRNVGELINIETDVIGKYVHKFLSEKNKKVSNVTMGSLIDAGW